MDIEWKEYPLLEGGSVDCEVKEERKDLQYRCSIWDNEEKGTIYTSPGFSIRKVTSQDPLDVAYPTKIGDISSITIGQNSVCRVVNDWQIECFKPPTSD